MRGRFDFTFHTLTPHAAALAEGDPTLAFLGAQGWEIRGVTTLLDGSVLVALQRPLDESLPLPDPSALSAALVEPLCAPSREESGLSSLRFASDAVYDVDIHAIPARPNEPAHDHYDVRFILEADPAEPLAGSPESHALAWVPLDDLVRYGADESVLRLARKTGTISG